MPGWSFRVLPPPNPLLVKEGEIESENSSAQFYKGPDSLVER